MGNSGKFTFGKLDAAMLGATADAWLRQASLHPGGVALNAYAAQLEYAKKIIAGDVVATAGTSLYGVFRDQERNVACALATMVPKGSGKQTHQLKMVEFTVEPALNVAETEIKFEELAWVAATGVVGAMELTYDQFKCNELKILANFPMTHEFLVAISAALFSKDGFKVESHGVSWIVIKKQ